MNGHASAADGKWHTVTVKPRHTSDRPQEAGKKAKVPDLASVGSRVEGNDSAFSALDNWYSDQQRQQHQKPSIESEEEASGSVSSEDEHRSSAEAAKHTVSDQPKKAKKPKVKRPKVKPAQAASGLEVSKYKELLSTVQQTYPDNQLSQLQTVADQLLESFQASELPFNKLLCEQHIDKVTDVPLQDLPLEVKSILETYATKLQVHVVAQFVQSLIDAVLEAVPDASNRQSVPKAKVGLLIFLSLLLRAHPAALLLQSQQLLAGGKKYSGPGRLHLLLWLINQTARCNAATAIGIWVRVLLPQILGTQLPTVQQKSAPSADSTVTALTAQNINISLQYLDHLLSPAQEAPLPNTKNDHGFPEWHGGSANLKAGNSSLHRLAFIGIRYVNAQETSTSDPVVPPAALEGIVRTQFGSSSNLQTAQRIKLLKQYEVLRDLAFIGSKNGGFSCDEALRLALDTAVLSDGPFQGPGDDTVDQAARNMLSSIACDPQAAAAWESRHNKQLKGSTRVLQHLLAVHPQHFRPLLSSSQGKAAFLKLLQDLRQRHKSQVKQGKGSLKTCAKASDAACTGLLKKFSSSRLQSFAVSTLLLTTTLGLFVLAFMRNKEGQEAWEAFAQTPPGQAISRWLGSIGGILSPYYHAAEAQLAPVVVQAQQRFDPVWHSVSQHAAAASQYAADRAWQGANQILSRCKSGDAHYT